MYSFRTPATLGFGLTFAGFACILAPAARAQASPADLVTLEVLPGWRSGEERHMAALQLTLAPGWKTYWRAPGAVGLAPIFDFSASTGIATVELLWPVPDVFLFGGMRTIGYHDAVTIPLDLVLDGGPAQLTGEIDLGVCKEVCVPAQLTFSADLPDTDDRDPVIVAALVDRPLTAEEAGARATCAVQPDGTELRLVARFTLPPLGLDEVVVIESNDPSLWISETDAAREGDTLVATAEVLARDGGAPAIDRSRLRFTVLSGGQAVDIQGCQAG